MNAMNMQKNEDTWAQTYLPKNYCFADKKIANRRKVL